MTFMPFYFWPLKHDSPICFHLVSHFLILWATNLDRCKLHNDELYSKTINYLKFFHIFSWMYFRKDWDFFFQGLKWEQKNTNVMITLHPTCAILLPQQDSMSTTTSIVTANINIYKNKHKQRISISIISIIEGIFKWVIVKLWTHAEMLTTSFRTFRLLQEILLLFTRIPLLGT